VLRELRVKNLALLEDAHVEFGPGLNVVTGATGAGKTLLLSALTLLLGGRFSKEMLRTGTDQASVDGVFDLDDETAASRARGRGRPSSEIVVRRRVDASGKNRCEVDGRLVSVGELRDLGRLLCEIHGQSEHQALLDPAEQTILLDRAAKLTDERALFAAKLATWRDLAARVAALKSGERDRAARVESLDAAVAEIRGAKIRVGEIEELRRERNAPRRRVASRRGARARGVAARRRARTTTARSTASAARRARSSATASSSTTPAPRRRRSISRRTASRSRAAPRLGARTRRVGSRRGSMTSRSVWHRSDACCDDTVPTRSRARGADEGRARARRSPRGADGADGLEMRLDDAERDVLAAGASLNDKRRKAAKPFAAAVKKSLADLGMPETRFVVDVRDGEMSPRPTRSRRRRVPRLPNPGEEIRPLAKIASGGELARVALAIKGELGRAERAVLLVFDEIDADVGPRLGAVIGRRLAEVARGRQALVVTHLPQVAAFGDLHLRVVKRTVAGRTAAHVEPLASAARELEIAEMIRARARARRRWIRRGRCWPM